MRGKEFGTQYRYIGFFASFSAFPIYLEQDLWISLEFPKTEYLWFWTVYNNYSTCDRQKFSSYAFVRVFFYALNAMFNSHVYVPLKVLSSEMDPAEIRLIR